MAVKQTPVPFRFVDAFSKTKRDVIRSGELPEALYVPYLANRSMSYHADAILYASEMNLCPALDHVMQFDFYTEALRARARYSPKWHKPDEDDEETVMCVARALRCNGARARDAMRLLRDEQLKQLVELGAKND